jgi:hypothetical protein
VERRKGGEEEEGGEDAIDAFWLERSLILEMMLLWKGV